MSHYTAEVVIPPNYDIQSAVEQVMDHFRDEDDDGNKGECEWWDFWIIGGRFAGRKLECQLDESKLADFHQVLADRKVTVAGMTSGKQTLQPVSQIPMVDALWREYFPGMGDKCLLFSHSWDQYGKQGILPADVCKVSEVPEQLTASRVILSDFGYSDNTKLRASGMLVAEFWNRCDWQKTDWSGNVREGIERLRTNFKGERRDIDDWRVVTVDYHN
jgi:hypothetical protein